MPQASLDNLVDDGQCSRPTSRSISDKHWLAVIEVIAAAFVMQFSTSYSGYGNHHDDLSAAMQLFQKQYFKDDLQRAQSFTNAFLSDMHRILALDVDYSGDKRTEIYLKNPVYQKALSMQLSLGYWGEQQHRSLSSKVAFATLQLRWAALTFAMGGLKLNAPRNIPSVEAESNRTEIVRSFFGIISWTLSLTNFVIDELFTLSNAAEQHGSMDQDVLEAKLSELNTPALALIFVSQSRLLFKHLYRFFRGLGAEVMQHRSHDPTWRELGTMFTKSLVPFHQFEKVITDVENGIRNIYQSNQFSDAERKEIEKNMLVSGSVPSRLWPAVEYLLTGTVKAVREEVNVAELYFHDISWLGLSDDKASDQWRKRHRLDVIRKVELPRRARIRQCTRCCSIMENAAPPKGTAGWLVNMWRSCVCGNWWMSVKDDGEQTDGNR
ncbi:MAG: hypothetical protein Q9201_007803 [Fulgogasparrea decipioides]